MPIIIKAALIGQGQGNVIISNAPTAIRINIGSEDNSKVPQRIIHQVLMGQSVLHQQGVLLAVSQKFLPEEITDGIRRGGFEAEFGQFCRAVVFMSHLTSSRGSWRNGFVIEKKGMSAHPNPFGFAGDEIRSICEGFLPDPYSAIFVNNFYSDGKPLSGLEYFSPLAYLTGFLKARRDLRLKGMSPDSACYDLKVYCAALFALQATQMLLVNLPELTSDGHTKEELQSQIVSGWIPRWQRMIDTAQNALTPFDLQLLAANTIN